MDIFAGTFYSSFLDSCFGGMTIHWAMRVGLWPLVFAAYGVHMVWSGLYDDGKIIHEEGAGIVYVTCYLWQTLEQPLGCIVFKHSLRSSSHY